MVVAVYFTNWSIYARGYSPSQLPLDSITHVIYAFFKPNAESGEIEMSDPWADIQKPMDLGGLGCIGEFQLLKKQYPHLRVVASVGGWTYSAALATILREPRKREVFLQSSTNIINKYGFDGLDIDWEYPENAADGEILRKTLGSLRQMLGPQKDLMIACPAAADKIANFPAAIDEYLTSWNIMNYDFTGPWSPVTGHHAQLYGEPGSQELSADSVLTLYSRKVHPSKLVLGIPLYGRSFANTKGLGRPFQGTLTGDYEAGVHDYKTLPPTGWKEYVDDKKGAAYCVQNDGLISYDNLDTVAMKADYARQHGLLGGMFWEASGDRDGELVKKFTQRFYRK